MRRGARAIAVMAAVVVAAGIGAPSASATTDRSPQTRLALQRAGVPPGSPGVALPERGSTIRAGNLTIDYPQAARTSRSIDAHTRVFDGRHFDQVVQSTGQDDVRLLTILADASAPTTYDYGFAGHDLRALDDGYVAVLDQDSGEPAAIIEPAWAKDAHGDAVPTRYQINGSTLTQVVEVTDDTVYPVVADPSVTTHWWGRQTRFTKSETERLLAGGTACSVLPYVGVACRVLMVWASTAWSMHKCLAVKQVWGAPAVPWYWSCTW